MRQFRVNFGAALIAMSVASACRPSGSTPARSDTTPASSAASAAATPDSVVIAADHGRTTGDSTIKTWVIIASDFQCPFCKQWHDASYRALYDEYVRPGRVRVAYVNFPLGQHQHAMATAEAAMCAAAQGKFWQFHDALFATQDAWSTLPSTRAVEDSIATSLALDRAKWTACVESGKMRPLIVADRNRLTSAGVQSTPSFLIGDTVLVGAIPMSELKAAIDAELAKRASPSR
ncbi:MAG TPA: thioredoxin domain-containing protein [Gemmatimonadaceae bacterium]|jgi:protein-disulfide isomerase